MSDTIGNGPNDGLDFGRIMSAQWADLSGALIAARLDLASGRLSYDYFNGGVSMKSNARYPDEPILLPNQMQHAAKIGTGAVLRPHLHWLQQQAARPNFLLGYKKMNQGTDVGVQTDYSNYTLLTPVSDKFIYVAQTGLMQLTTFAEINISDLTLSAQINFVLFRDTGNVSGLFAGIDPVAADVTVLYQDQHVQLDTYGSREEYIK